MKALPACLLVLLLLSGCSSPPVQVLSNNQNYEGELDGSVLRLACDDADWLRAKCSLLEAKGETPPSASQQMRLAFIPAEGYLQNLLRESARKTLLKGQGSTQAAGDAPFLASLQSSSAECFQDSEMGDLLAMCVARHGKVTRPVLFMRGLCDSCTFSPIILRKIN